MRPKQPTNRRKNMSYYRDHNVSPYQSGDQKYYSTRAGGYVSRDRYEQDKRENNREYSKRERDQKKVDEDCRRVMGSDYDEKER